MVDFSAFSVKQTVARRSLVIGLLGVGSLVVNAPILLFLDSDGIVRTLAAIYFYASLLACVGGLSVYFLAAQWFKREAFIQFLLDNGWHPTEETDFTNIATSLIEPEGQPSIAFGFAGSYGGLEMHAVKYVYITGSNKSAVSHKFVNLSFDLKHSFPLVVLDDRKNDFLFASNLPERVAGGKPLQLEGNFNNRFRLTVLPDTERDVLQLLTPDFMHELLESRVAADIEIQANKLFIIAGASEFDEKTLRNLFGMADIVLKNLAELSDTWQASSSADALAKMTAVSLGPRLGLMNLKSKNAGTIGFLFVLTAYLSLLVIGLTQ